MIQSTTDSLPDVRGTSHSRYAPCLTSFIVILFSPQSSSASPMIVDQELLLALAPVTGKAEDFTLTTDIETTAPNGTLLESECSLYSKILFPLWHLSLLLEFPVRRVAYIPSVKKGQVECRSIHI